MFKIVLEEMAYWLRSGCGRSCVARRYLVPDA